MMMTADDDDHNRMHAQQRSDALLRAAVDVRVVVQQQARAP